jgi:hypothetical protein
MVIIASGDGLRKTQTPRRVGATRGLLLLVQERQDCIKDSRQERQPKKE